MADTKDEEQEKEEPSFELVLDKLGALGKFQLIQATSCNLSYFLTAFVVLAFVFEGYEPDHICNAEKETDLLSKHGLQNDSSAQVIYESCEIRILSNQSGKVKEIDSMNCPNGRNFFDAKHTTFLSEWDLVCESSGVAELSQTCFNVGQLIGAVIGPAIADRYGRRPVFIASSFLTTIMEWCIVAAPNIFVVYGFKLASGVFYQSLVCTFFVYAMEFITPRHREAAGCLSCAIWVVATMAVGAVGYLFRNDSWRYVQGSTGVVGLFTLAYPFVMHESPRWLAANGKIDEALQILEKASKMNGKNFEEVKETFLEYVNHAFLSSNSHSLPMIGNGNQDFSDDVIVRGNKSDEERKPNIFDLIKNKNLRSRTLITWYLYVTNILTYFGIYMTSSNVAGNRFLNYTLLTLVEFPSVMCLYYLMDKLSRRIVVIFFLSLTTVSLMTSTLLITFAENLEGSDVASTAFFILGKFAITASFNAVFIMCPEIFPTNLRSTANGFCSGLARVGAMVAPFMRPLYNVAKWGPGSIFTVMCLVAIGLTAMLPESKDAKLPDTIDDTEKKGEARTKMNKYKMQR